MSDEDFSVQDRDGRPEKSIDSIIEGLTAVTIDAEEDEDSVINDGSIDNVGKWFCHMVNVGNRADVDTSSDVPKYQTVSRV